MSTIHPDQTVEEAMELMNSRHIRHLPVVADEKVMGMISIGDVVKAIIFKQRAAIKDMENKINQLCEKIARKTSPDLRKAVEKMREDLRAGRLLRELGLTQ